MQRGHAVDRVRADHGEVGHAEGLAAALVHEGADAFLVVVAGPLRLDALHEAAVDLENDLGVARQHAGEKRHGPLLQRLGEQRVVGVAEGQLHDGPGGVPAELLLIDKDALELGDGHRGMGVVQLHRDLGGEVFPGVAGDAEVAANEIAQRAADKKVLLDEAQLLAVLRLVVRVENLRDGLADRLLAHRLDVAAGVERAQVKLLGRARGPETQEVHGLGAVARDGNVVGHAEDLFRVHPAGTIAAAVVKDVFDPTVELHLLGVFGAADFPRRAEDHPVVGMLDLVAVDELLLEEAELVVDAVADRRVVERGERIEETGRETTEAAVAQAHVHLDLAQLVKVDAELGQRGARGLDETGVLEVVLGEPAHQILEREVVEAADVVLVVHRLGRDEAGEDLFAHRGGGRQPPVAQGRGALVAGEGVGQVAQDGLLQLHAVGRAFRGLHRVQGRGRRGRDGFGGGFARFGCGRHAWKWVVIANLESPRNVPRVPAGARSFSRKIPAAERSKPGRRPIAARSKSTNRRVEKFRFSIFRNAELFIYPGFISRSPSLFPYDRSQRSG